MPVFHLSNDLVFPPAHLARNDGLLCVGGDLSPERLILAYRNGIFPWFSKGEPVLWWSPDPRLVLFPRKVSVSRSLAREIRKHRFTVTMDQAFDRVIQACADTPNRHDKETWLVDGMIPAYQRLHQMGIAHSVETWYGDDLASGLYGVSMGGVFFGESMFHRKSNASKVALVALCRQLTRWKYSLIDCQVATGHLVRMGAEEIPRSVFVNVIHRTAKQKTVKGPWSFDGFDL